MERLLRMNANGGLGGLGAGNTGAIWKVFKIAKIFFLFSVSYSYFYCMSVTFSLKTKMK